MVTLVEQMLELHSRMAGRRPVRSRDAKLYQRQIDASDRELDKLVYELYELTEEESKSSKHSNDGYLAVDMWVVCNILSATQTLQGAKK